MFIRAAAAGTFQRLLAGQLLAGISVRHIMHTDLVAVPPDLPLSQLTENILLQRGLKRVPVIDDAGRPLGCVGVDEVKRVPPEERFNRITRDILSPLAPESMISPDAQAKQALEQMQRTRRDHLFVTEAGRLTGVLTLKGLLQYLRVKSELEATA
jgi:CBS domain-containing protein